LLYVEVDGTTCLLEEYIARRLAKHYRLEGDSLPAQRPLNHVVSQLVLKGREQLIRGNIAQIMKQAEADLRPSKPLRQLAEITDFNLFVTTTFDSMLGQAIDEVRYGGRPETKFVDCTPKKPTNDLPCDKDQLTGTTVVHLMGKLSPGGDCVISDEDLLERVCHYQQENRRPDKLLGELKKHHLLILGAGFSDWLARFFLRTAKGGRLSAVRDLIEILADGNTHRDTGLVSFLLHFSSHTQVFPVRGAVDFVDELWMRWRERQPQSSRAIAEPDRSVAPANAIFISYARQDLPAVQELKAGLEAAGLPAWLDIEDLRPGEDFNPRIKKYITEGCRCFIPVISKNTESRPEGYFRKEWKLAVERDRGIHSGYQFIMPVVVDDTDKPAVVEPRFEELNFTWLPGGKVTAKFVRDLKENIGRF
jgi:hypothetical protein